MILFGPLVVLFFYQNVRLFVYLRAQKDQKMLIRIQKDNRQPLKDIFYLSLSTKNSTKGRKKIQNDKIHARKTLCIPTFISRVPTHIHAAPTKKYIYTQLNSFNHIHPTTLQTSFHIHPSTSCATLVHSPKKEISWWRNIWYTFSFFYSTFTEAGRLENTIYEIMPGNGMNYIRQTRNIRENFC